MRTVTGVYGNAIVRVHHPELTTEERERIIEKEIKPALAWFGRQAISHGVDLEAWSAKKQAERDAQEVAAKCG